MFDLQTAIDDDAQTGIVGDFDGLLVDDTVLKPDGLSPGCDRVACDLRAVCGLSEDVDDIGRSLRCRIGRERWVTRHAVDVRRRRIDAQRVDAMRPQIFIYEIARSERARARADDRDVPSGCDEIT